MNLREYLKAKRLRPYRFAIMVGMSPATLYRNLAGKTRMSANLAVKIEQFTKGEITRAEAMWPNIKKETYDK